jgi:hypothetical protein
MVRNLHKGSTFVRCSDYVSILLRDFRRDATASCFALVLIVPKIRKQGGGSTRTISGYPTSVEGSVKSPRVQLTFAPLDSGNSIA